LKEGNKNMYCNFKCQVRFFFFLQWCNNPRGPRRSPYRGFMITLRHTTLGRTPLDEWWSNAETSTWQHTTPTRDKHPYPRRDSNPQPPQPSGRRPTP